MAEKKIKPANPAVDAKRAEVPKAAELADRKTASAGARSARRAASTAAEPFDG